METVAFALRIVIRSAETPKGVDAGSAISGIDADFWDSFAAPYA
jgi:hypothetical protein